MPINGNFLEGHKKGFHEGVAGGWEAGYLQALKDMGIPHTGPVPEPAGIEYTSPMTDLSEQLETLLKEDRISIRAFNCLTRNGIHTINDLVHKSEAQLTEIRNFGAKCMDEIKTLLDGMGMALKEPEDI